MVIKKLEAMLGRSFLYQSYLYKILSYKIKNGFVIITTDSELLKLPLNQLQDSLKLFVAATDKKIEAGSPVIDEEFIIMKRLTSWWMQYW